MARWYAVNWTRYHSLLTALAEKGCEVHVLQPPSLESKETNFQEIEAVEHPNIKIITVPINENLWKFKFPLEKLFKKAIYSIMAYSFAKKYCLQEDIDVVMLYNIPQYQFMKLRNVTCVFDYADDYIDMLKIELGKASNPIALGLARRLLKNMLSKSELTLSVSHELAKDQPGNIHVLPNGVSLSDCVDTEKREVHEVPIVGFIGSFEYFINFDIIIAAAKRLPEIQFLLVGSGREYKRVEQRIFEEGLTNIELTGGVPHHEVFTRINQMDICLNIFTPIATSHRACPIKLFEYMSQFKPVISTRLHELKHIDKDFLYYADDENELVSMIKHILNKPDETNEKTRLGYRETLNNYTWEKIADHFIEMMDEIKS